MVRNGIPVTSRTTKSTPPSPPNQSQAAPAGSTRKVQNTRFSAYNAINFASRTVKALTGMDSSRSASRPPKMTPCAAKAVKTSPAITAIAGIITSRSSRQPASASCPPRAKLYIPETYTHSPAASSSAAQPEKAFFLLPPIWKAVSSRRSWTLARIRNFRIIPLLSLSGPGTRPQGWNRLPLLRWGRGAPAVRL